MNNSFNDKFGIIAGDEPIREKKKKYIRIPEHSRRVPNGVKRVRAHIRKIR